MSSLQLFDALDPATEAALRASIERFGVIVPVLTDQHGTIIDGHHRSRIARELNVPYRELARTVADEDEAREVARTLNMDRRHLTVDQRREVVAQLRREGHSFRAIGSALGISHEQARKDDDGSGVNQLTRGRDGKTYPSQRPDPEPEQDDEAEPLFAEGEPEAILDHLEDVHGDELTADHITDALEENLESKQVPEPRAEWTPTKPDLGDGISHPARYSRPLLEEFRSILNEYGAPGGNILDPFAGTGLIHELAADGWETIGVEIEKEYADMHPNTVHASALDLPFDPWTFGAIVTSPTYGNRLADSHNATDPERRRSYTHDLGHELDPNNSGTYHWRTPPGRGAEPSEAYRTFHLTAWGEAVNVLRPGGLFVLNCCDHIRDGLTQPVTAWHCWALGRLGLEYVESRSVATQKLRQGDNASLRHQEQVHVFRRPR